ncbi:MULTISPECIES: Pr6Pr family membrane protein [unclassified Microbacterium]|uniref:Pr6Pr family membrane protein n=1 Tax=unclassified Microbacterium TaxID=2609290 RepID=UPI00386FFAB3
MPTKPWPAVWSIARVVAAAAMIAAVITQLTSTVTGALEAGRDLTTVVTNFFSFFTILSNSLGALVLLAAAIWFWVRPPAERQEPRALAIALASVTAYLLVTGIVYNLLLRGLTPSDAEVRWTNEVLHVAAPVFFALDLFLAPGRRALPWRSVLAIMVFPLVWIGYTLWRGPLVTNPNDGVPFWYPYPFLNPNGVAGWGGVGAYVVGIATGFVLIGLLIVAISRWRARRTAGRGEVTPAAAEPTPAR